MAKKYKYNWKRTDNRSIKNRLNEDRKPLLIKATRKYDDDLTKIEMARAFAKSHNEDIDNEVHLTKYEEFAKRVLKNHDLPTDILSKEFAESYKQKKLSPFDDEEIAKSILWQVFHIRRARDNNDINLAIIETIRLGDHLKAYDIKLIEKNAVIGAAVTNSNPPQANREGMIAVANKVIDTLPKDIRDNKPKKARTMVYDAVKESAGKEFSREHIRTLLAKHLEIKLGKYKDIDN